MMKCKEELILVKWNPKVRLHGGETHIIKVGDNPFRRNPNSINGEVFSETCGGNIICKIYAESGYDDGCGSSPELVIEFLCERCGIGHNLDYSIEDIEKIVNNHI